VDGRRELIRETVPYRSARSKDEDGAVIEVLLLQVTDFSISWRGQSARSWTQMWEAQRQLPTAFHADIRVLAAATSHVIIDLASH